jgi:hypothetical protein
MSARTEATLRRTVDLQMLRDYVVDLHDALAAGDEPRAKTAMATIGQATYSLSLSLGSLDSVCSVLYGTRPASALAAEAARS